LHRKSSASRHLAMRPQNLKLTIFAMNTLARTAGLVKKSAVTVKAFCHVNDTRIARLRF
jgi:hypothetical protein